MKKRVGVIMGGPSAEREVALAHRGRVLAPVEVVLGGQDPEEGVGHGPLVDLGVRDAGPDGPSSPSNARSTT